MVGKNKCFIRGSKRGAEMKTFMHLLERLYKMKVPAVFNAVKTGKAPVTMI